MRIEQENGIITLMRGDTLSTPIYINDGTKLDPVIRSLQTYERLYFALMGPGQAFEDAIVKKVYDTSSPKDSQGNTLLVLQPKDTERLLTGKYYYTIKLRAIDEQGVVSVRTLVSPTLFWLDGNNPVSPEPKYWEQGKYDIDKVIIEGGEVDTNIPSDNIIFDGGEIV